MPGHYMRLRLCSCTVVVMGRVVANNSVHLLPGSIGPILAKERMDAVKRISQK